MNTNFCLALSVATQGGSCLVCKQLLRIRLATKGEEERQSCRKHLSYCLESLAQASLIGVDASCHDLGHGRPTRSTGGTAPSEIYGCVVVDNTLSILRTVLTATSPSEPLPTFTEMAKYRSSQVIRRTGRLCVVICHESGIARERLQRQSFSAQSLRSHGLQPLRVASFFFLKC